MQTKMIELIAIYALPILLAITVHEASHGFIAKYCGDNTAYRLGRVTLNPLKHIDFLGTIAVPIASLMLGGGLFGWAKPVPVNFGLLRNPKRDMVLVAVAGPLANLLMALFWDVLYKLSFSISNEFALPAMLMSQAGLHINYVLMIFNLLPILPLDGGRIVQGFMPSGYLRQYSKTENYGIWIFLALILSGLLSKILDPLVHFFMGWTIRLLG